MFHALSFKKSIIPLFFLLAVCSCSKRVSTFDITSGKPIFIVESEASGPFSSTAVELRPYEATVTIKEAEANKYDISVSYDFLKRDKHSKIGFYVPSVSGIVADESYSFTGEHLTGSCTYSQGVTCEYNDITVGGVLGFNSKSAFSITGTINNKPFHIGIKSISANNPGSMASDMQTNVQPITYLEQSFKNTSGMHCELVFDIQELKSYNQINGRCSLDIGEERSLGFFSDNGFWMDTCSGLVISFQDGTLFSFSNDEIRMMPEGDQKGCLKYWGSETDRYLGVVGTLGIIEPVPYIRDLFEIL